MDSSGDIPKREVEKADIRDPPCDHGVGHVCDVAIQLGDQGIGIRFDGKGNAIDP